MQVIEIPNKVNIEYFDGTKAERGFDTRYCFTTGFKDLDEYFGLGQICENAPNFRRKHTADLVKFIIDCSGITYTCPIYATKEKLKINSETMERIKNIEDIYKINIKDRYELADDDLDINFNGLKPNKTVIEIFIIVKKLGGIMLKDYINVNEDLIGVTYEDIFQKYKSRIENIHIKSIYQLDNRKYNYFVCSLFNSTIREEKPIYELYIGDKKYSINFGIITNILHGIIINNKLPVEYEVTNTKTKKAI